MPSALEISALKFKQPDYAQSKHTIPAEPNRATYRGFETETYISQKKSAVFSCARVEKRR